MSSTVTVTQNNNLVQVNQTTNEVEITQAAPTQVTIQHSGIQVSGGSGSAEWGDITGTLSDQTDLQTELDGKEDTITTLPISKGGTNSSTALSNNRVIKSASGAIVEAAAITASRALVSDANGIPTHATTTTTELNYVSGVTSAIQTQLNAKESTITVLPVSKGGTNSSSALNNNRIIRSSGGAIGEASAITASRALVSDANGIPTHATTTTTELNYVSGVTSAIQTQLNAKEATITTLTIAKGGTNSGTALNNNRVMQSSGGKIVEATAITASRALISDANGIPTHSTVTSTELGYVSGVTSAIQTQLTNKAGVQQTDFISGYIETVADGTIIVILNIPYAITISSVTTKCVSGTCTLTGQIEGVNLGGTANSVSSSKQERTHSSANTASVGADIQVSISSNSSCLGLSFTIKFIRTLT